MTRDGEDYEADQRAAINRQSFAVVPPTEPPKACPTCPQWSMDHCSCPSLRECAREAGRR